MYCSVKTLVVGSYLFTLFFMPASFNTLSARGADRHVGGGSDDAGIGSGHADFYGDVGSSSSAPGAMGYGSPENYGEHPVYTKIDPNQTVYHYNDSDPGSPYAPQYYQNPSPGPMAGQFYR
jgi:hypothetical protein